jgi:hypothetical protein
MSNNFLENKYLSIALFIIVIAFAVFLSSNVQTEKVYNAGSETIPSCDPEGVLTPANSGRVICPSETISGESEDAKNLGLAIISDDLDYCVYIVDADTERLCRNIVYDDKEYLSDYQKYIKAGEEGNLDLCYEIIDSSLKKRCISEVSKRVG